MTIFAYSLMLCISSKDEMKERMTERDVVNDFDTIEIHVVSTIAASYKVECIFYISFESVKGCWCVQTRKKRMSQSENLENLSVVVAETSEGENRYYRVMENIEIAAQVVIDNIFLDRDDDSTSDLVFMDSDDEFYGTFY